MTKTNPTRRRWEVLESLCCRLEEFGFDWMVDLNPEYPETNILMLLRRTEIQNQVNKLIFTYVIIVYYCASLKVGEQFPVIVHTSCATLSFRADY